MKKEIIIVIIIIICIIIGHILTQKYTRNFFDEISNDLQKIEDDFFDDSMNNSNMKNDIDEVQRKWDDKYDVLAYYLEHDELEKVQTQLIGIKANIEAGEYDKCVEKIEICKFILKHIEDKDSFKLVNIF